MDPFFVAHLARERYEDRLREAARARSVFDAKSVQKLPLLVRMVILIFS